MAPKRETDRVIKRREMNNLKWRLAGDTNNRKTAETQTLWDEIANISGLPKKLEHLEQHRGVIPEPIATALWQRGGIVAKLMNVSFNEQNKKYQAPTNSYHQFIPFMPILPIGGMNPYYQFIPRIPTRPRRTRGTLPTR